MNRLGVAFRNGENRLPDHAFQDAVCNFNGGFPRNGRQLRILLRRNAYDGKIGRPALDGGDFFLIGCKVDGICRKSADNVAEKAGAQHNASGFFHLCFYFCGHSQLKVITAQCNFILTRFQQNSFQGGNR
ncbi:hypothetical protein SDC9_206582 [bioreactor metagenome]|uniref:Uncharacterized protein n=1 Tax=bioreactor metagenome TaxID=1076179 RepID=A0A645J5Y4_9ZZZZ